MKGGQEMSESLGERIRRTRMNYGMSQAELARRIKVSLNTIADVLGVSADYLLGREDEAGELLPAAVA
jgi:ribosome-binding protein aMBF1 (putative translation factor)